MKMWQQKLKQIAQHMMYCNHFQSLDTNDDFGREPKAMQMQFKHMLICMSTFHISFYTKLTKWYLLDLNNLISINH